MTGLPFAAAGTGGARHIKMKGGDPVDRRLSFHDHLSYLAGISFVTEVLSFTLNLR
jgi:hypothetical protein